MSRGSTGVLKDLDKQLKDARKNLRGTSKSVLKDLEGLQEKLTPSRGGAKRTTSTARKTSSRSTASRASSARKSSGARKAASAGRSASGAAAKKS